MSYYFHFLTVLLYALVPIVFNAYSIGNLFYEIYLDKLLAFLKINNKL